MKTEKGDIFVPITWAYNHHCEAYLTRKYSNMFQEKFPNPRQWWRIQVNKQLINFLNENCTLHIYIIFL